MKMTKSLDELRNLDEKYAKILRMRESYQGIVYPRIRIDSVATNPDF